MYGRLETMIKFHAFYFSCSTLYVFDIYGQFIEKQLLDLIQFICQWEDNQLSVVINVIRSEEQLFSDADAQV